MRKCCCCISVHTGALILGSLAVLLSLLELVVLIPYFLQIEEFNPIEGNLNHFYYVFQKFLLEHNVTSERAADIVDNVKEWTWVALLSEALFAGIYILISLSMIIGVQCRMRGLMLPYLIVQMIIVIVFVVFTVGVSVLVFFVNVIMASVLLVVSLVTSFLFIYFWAAVQKSYLELGNGDWEYEPTPVKPIYNPSRDDRYHPSAPQHFNME